MYLSDGFAWAHRQFQQQHVHASISCREYISLVWLPQLQRLTELVKMHTYAQAVNPIQQVCHKTSHTELAVPCRLMQTL